MAIDITSTVERSGATMIQLLTYCVYSQQLDPIFQLLVRNYRLQPKGPKAVALYEDFIVPHAPLLITASRVEKSSDWQLNSTIEKIRNAERLLGQPINDEENAPVHVSHLPAKNIYDTLLTAVEKNSVQFAAIESAYDPERTAVENLPGGELTPTQRQYNERIWKPARQRLTAAGFFTIANIGG